MRKLLWASLPNDLVQSSVSYMLSDNVENLTLIGTAAINGTSSHPTLVNTDFFVDALA